MVDPKSESIEGVAKPGAGMKKLGGSMLVACFACLFIGRGIARVFFPKTQGKGITPGMWFVLIPIWSVGIIGFPYRLTLAIWRICAGWL